MCAEVVIIPCEVILVKMLKIFVVSIPPVFRIKFYISFSIKSIFLFSALPLAQLCHRPLGVMPLSGSASIPSPFLVRNGFLFLCQA